MENTERDLQIVRKVAPQIMTKRAIADAKQGKYNPPSWKGTAYLNESLSFLSTEIANADRDEMAKIARENVEYFSELYKKAYQKYQQSRAKVA